MLICHSTIRSEHRKISPSSSNTVVLPRIAAVWLLRDGEKKALPANRSFMSVIVAIVGAPAVPTVLALPILLLATLLFASSASAQPGVSGVYFGVQGGVVDYFATGDVCEDLLEEIEESANDESDDDISSTVAQILDGADCTGDSKDTGLGIFAGYRFNRNFAFELGYVDLGSVTAELMNSTRIEGARLDAEGSAQLDANGIMASALISIPIGPHVSVFGRLGVLAWDADLSANASGTIRIGGRRITFDDLREAGQSRSGTDAAYGAGMRFAFNENMAIRAEFTRFETIDVNSGWLGLEVSLN